MEEAVRIRGSEGGGSVSGGGDDGGGGDRDEKEMKKV